MSDIDQIDPEKTDLLEQIGRRIRRARENAHLTQGELATLIGKTQKAISGYEQGTRAIRITEVPELARALGVSPNYLYGDDSVDTEQIIGAAYRQLIPLFQRISADVIRQFVIIQDRWLKEHKDLANPISATLPENQPDQWGQPSFAKKHAEILHSETIRHDGLMTILWCDVSFKILKIDYDLHIEIPDYPNKDT